MSTIHLEVRENKKVLMLGEQPFIMISGEVYNSNSSTLEAMESVWKKAETLGLNSLLLPVSWEMIEPEEGKFDFQIVDGLIAQAREHAMKIGFLWFGAWKNAQCYYAPDWVKTDLNRFKRAQMVRGENHSRLEYFHGMSYTSLSYLCEETKVADAKAFAALMAHIRETDSEEQTVIWMQIENETGVMGAAREMSDEADRIFAEAVPQELVDYMRSHTDTMVAEVKDAVEAGKESGSWSEVFGNCADEIFSAYHVASYVNYVAVEGSKEYQLPYSVNCWLDKGGEPGNYPSGGPIRKMMEVWKFCAPEIDVLAPDIYVPNFMEICENFATPENPLVIPETAVHSYCGPRLLYTIGHYHALCYSPFGFEDMGEPFGAEQNILFGMDITDPALKTPQDVSEYGWYTRTLRSMIPLLSEKYGSNELQAVSSESKTDMMNFGKYGFKAMMDERLKPVIGNRTDGVCLVLRESENTFYIVLCGCVLEPFSTDLENQALDFLDLEEGYFENGEWVMTRRRNGDEAGFLGFTEPTLLRVRLFAYH